MKIVVALDSFKECFSAKDGCSYVRKGLERANSRFEVMEVPMADGGEGTSDILASYYKAQKIDCVAFNALSKEVRTYYYYSTTHKIAIIESAAICGLEMIRVEERNPLIATSYGLGQLIKKAVCRGAKKIIIGLGGTACNDGGIGMLEALGATFIKKEQIVQGISVLDLCKITDINLRKAQELLKDTELIIANDVENVFIGQLGATRVFSPQKGAIDLEVDLLEEQLVKMNALVTKKYNVDLSKVKGSGAAGGLGGAFYLLGGTMEKGIELIMKEVSLERVIKESDLVISGEGKIDSQSVHGKTISGIANICKKHHVPLLCLTGSLKDNVNELYSIGISSIYSITNEPKSLKQALQDGPKSIENVAYNIGKLITIFE